MILRQQATPIVHLNVHVLVTRHALRVGGHFPPTTGISEKEAPCLVHCIRRWLLIENQLRTIQDSRQHKCVILAVCRPLCACVLLGVVYLFLKLILINRIGHPNEFALVFVVKLVGVDRLEMVLGLELF